jgi:uncharacterized RDD family membrane protein YckC
MEDHSRRIDHPDHASRLDATTVVPPNLARRVYAAGIDIAIVGLCCGALFLSFNPVFGSTHPWIWRPAAGVLAVLAIVEIITGITPGKWLSGLWLRARDGKSLPLWALALRALVRWAPVGLFLLSLGTDDRMTWMFIVQVLIVVVGCYLTICYMTLWRRGTTMFDAIAGTTVIRR